MPREKSDATDGSAVAPETDATGTETPPTIADQDDEAQEPIAPEEALAEAGTPPEPPVADPADVVDPVPPAARAPAPGAPAESQPTAMAPEAPVPPPPAMPPEPEREELHEEHHEDEGTSLAARTLTVLLILIAGIALGIWGAPRLAPLLPAGLAPVADWLAPGQKRVETRIAELEARLDAGLGGVDSRFSGLATSGDVDNRIAAATAALEGRLSGEIGTMRDELGQVDGADTRQRLARLDSTLEGQAAELQALKGQIEAGVAAGAAGEEVAQQVDVYRAELEGLRAEMGRLSDEVQGLGARVDEVEADADRQIAAAESRVEEVEASADTALSRAELDADVALVHAAIAGGLPFEQPLARIAEQPDITVPEGLTGAAGTGVMTLPALRDAFPDAAHAAIRADIMAGAGDGVIARSRAFLAAQVASRSLTPQAGDAADAVLSRMEDRLREDDLAGALAEAEALPPEAATAMEDWLAAARLRQGAVTALAALDEQLPAIN